MGTVFLVGSGPGDAAYLTVRARDVLAQAEVVVYDALVDEQLLNLTANGCKALYVGKRGGQPSTKQDEIDRLLVQLCQSGKRVVRLKSGDPFIFGRSLSEIRALVEAQCPFEVVPGLSSALVAPLLAHIPLTDPVLSRCFVVVSAHAPDALDWDAIARLDTLVILMGGKHLPDLVQRLQDRGRAARTPIAVIRWAGQARQQIWTGTLDTILHATAGHALSPCVMVIGEVVALRPFLRSPHSSHNDRWQLTTLPSPTAPPSPLVPSPMPSSSPPTQNAAYPLAHTRILVTRSVGQSSQFTQLLQSQGATVLEMPALTIGPPSSWQALDAAIAHMQEFDWLILTSANGVEYFFDRLATHGKDARALAGIKLAVVGQKTANSLRTKGLRPDFVPPDYVADALVEHFPEPALEGIRLLFPRVETGGREVLVQELTQRGAIVTEVPAYQSCCPDTIAPEVIAALEAGHIDVITFASSKTVECFHRLITQAGIIDNHHPSWLTSICLASIGPQTSKTCVELLGRVDVEATQYTLEGLTQAIANWALRPHGSYER